MTESTQPKPDVEAQNIAAYERVFIKSIEAAKRVSVHIGHGGAAEISKNREEEILAIGTAIFKQFFSDQGTITQAQRNAEAMVRGISGVMEGRGA